MILFSVFASDSKAYFASIDREGDTLKIAGHIDEGLYSRLIREYHKSPYSRIVIDTQGGDFFTAIYVGQFIRDKGISVQCLSCISAGGLIALGDSSFEGTVYLHKVMCLSECSRNLLLQANNVLKNYIDRDIPWFVFESQDLTEIKVHEKDISIINYSIH